MQLSTQGNEVAETLAELLADLQIDRTFKELDDEEILRIAEDFLLDNVPELCSSTS